MMVRASIFDVRSPMLSGAQSTPHSVTSAHHPLVVKQATCVVAGVAMIVRLDSYCRLPQDQAAAKDWYCCIDMVSMDVGQQCLPNVLRSRSWSQLGAALGYIRGLAGYLNAVEF
eukprot:m.20757 g.20757  ORF g.20757 m.20757 type:complete len:114 (-) comp11050_c0_seq3:15-356(-)